MYMSRQSLCVAFVAAIALGGSAEAVVLEPLTGFGGGDGFIATGERSYLPSGTGNAERGLAYNPVTNNLYVVSRTGGLNLAILNADTGDEVGVVPLTGLSSGTFVASQVRVADDGAIYVANLTTGATATAPFKIYRYASEADLQANTFTEAFNGVPIAGRRFGDNFNVRGSGNDTQLIAGAGSNFNDVAVFSTTDGSAFTATGYTLPGLANAGDAAGGVAFGPGNTFYTKQVGDNLRLFSFTPDTSDVALLQDYATGGASTALGRVGPIDVDTLSSLLGALSIPSGTPSPDSVRLFDITDPANLVESDFETFPVDFANANTAGSVDFGNGRLYVLDTNNGLLALTAVPEPTTLGLAGIAAVGLLARRRRA